MGKKYLFGVPAAQLDEALEFGVKNGQHAAHLYRKGEAGHVAVTREAREADEKNTQKNGMEQVSTSEGFLNEGDFKNREYFFRLAKKAASVFENPDAGSDLINVMYSVKDYLMATGRNAQQDAIKVMSCKMLNYHEKNAQKIQALKKQISTANAANKPVDSKLVDRLKKEQQRAQMLSDFANTFQKQFSGNLEVPEQEQQTLNDIKPEDPAHTFMGKTLWGQNGGYWQESQNVLFPHDPSPMDVKQGVGLQDCFMLSALTTIADKDPDFIKNCMKDNNDGTVTIRFFNKSKTNAEVYEPVYIKVNKSVNQTVFGHNLYASSSLWVQMMEKGYSEYMKRFGANPDNGMANINKGGSASFLGNFTGKPHNQRPFYESFGASASLYLRDKDNNFINQADYYLPEEEKVFNILSNAVNNRKEVMTAGTDTGRNNDPKPFNDVGIRCAHAYSVMKLFESKVVENGIVKTKKFVQLRDPYAVFTPGYDKNGKLVNKSSEIKGTLSGGMQNMGTFNLDLKDFLHYFASFAVSKETSSELLDVQKTFRNYEKHPLSEQEKKGAEFFDHSFDNDPLFNLDEMNELYQVREIDNKDNADDFTIVDGPDKKQEEKVTDDFVIVDEPDKKQEEKNIFDDFVDVDLAKKEEKPINETEEIIDRPVDDDLAHRSEIEELANQLNDKDLPALAEKIKVQMLNLNCTDEFFFGMNSKEFKNLKASVKELNDQLTAAIKGGTLTDDAKQRLAAKMVDTRDKSSKYLDYKTDRIKKETSKGKVQSNRSMQRLTIAVSISNLCSGAEPLAEWPTMKAEQIATMMDDMQSQLNFSANNIKVPQTADINRVKSTLAAIAGQLKTNPELNKQVEKIRLNKASDIAENKPAPVEKQTQKVSAPPQIN